MRQFRCLLVALSAALSAAMTPAALAVPPEAVTFTAVPSNGLLNSPANAVRIADFVGGYTLGRITYSGTMTSMHASTWSSDARILLTAPSGQTAVIVPFATGGQFTTLPFSGSLFMPVGTAAAGAWTLRFYETVDNGGPSAVDALVTLTLTLTDEPPAPPAATDLGDLSAPGVSISGIPVASGEVRWYRFTLPQVIVSDRRTYLDIDTNGSTGGSALFPNDTEIAVYAADGRLVAHDDDAGPGFTSALTFGAGGRPPIGDGIPLDGRHGPLLPRTYYLAVAWSRASFGSERWEVVGGTSTSGTITVTLATNASEAVPCTADWNGDGTVNSTDISAFLATWLGSVGGGPQIADTNDDGVVNSTDISAFLAAWLGAIAGGC